MKLLFTICFVLICFTVSGQNQKTSKKDSLLAKYSSYFDLPRESLFTHINKTTFIVGESLWFKVYVHDRHFDEVSKSTTNINVGIYDEKGNLIKNDLWMAVNGATTGNILIDSTFKTGNYYIKSSTNWMRNFKESDAHVQKISVVGSEIPNKQDSIPNNLDLQFLPEGGHIVADVQNVIGLKILNKNGKGVKLEGIIYDNADNIVTTFESNKFGIGKFLLTPKAGITYTAKIELINGREISKTIENIEAKGIAIQVSNLNPEKLVLTLNTNIITHNVIKDKIFTIVLHKNGHIKTIPFSFRNQKNITLAIPKSDLFSDMNIITVLDDTNTPLLERLIFNDKFKISKSKYNIGKVKSENDSIVYSIHSSSSTSKDSLSGLSNLSISVLPESTSGYHPDHNIISAFYLKPYLNGYIESPSYYFKDISRKKSYELDMLLLTQGWSRYDWNYIFYNKPKSAFSFNNGVTLRGKLLEPEGIKVLKMQSLELMGNDWQDLEVDSNNVFEKENLYPYKNEAIRISYLDKDNKYKKPKLSLGITLPIFEDTLVNYDLTKNPLQLIELSIPEHKSGVNFFYENAQELEEVLLTGKTRKEEEQPKDVIAPSYTFKDNYLAITEEEIRKFPKIIDVLSYRGYQVYQDMGVVYIKNRNSSSPSSSGVPLIFIDGVRLNDFSILFNLLSNNIEGISVDKSGLGYGVSGAEGVIKIYTRTTSLYNNVKQSEDYTFTFEVKNGFTKAKKFYTPRYKSYTSSLFRNYGVIGWLPIVQLENNMSKLFKLSDTNSKTINFYIEGYDSENNLVSQIFTLDN
ncbi:TonB-dependent receptor [Winogradskyella vidalii]|uniref:hypothetical protein n=1 Tax=Winogradskyella vidalii TaxID=2615024 RepID=UPI0015C9E875|nr:hypothetical protein [Winogradskyella vidalii]